MNDNKRNENHGRTRGLADGERQRRADRCLATSSPGNSSALQQVHGSNAPTQPVPSCQPGEPDVEVEREAHNWFLGSCERGQAGSSTPLAEGRIHRGRAGGRGGHLDVRMDGWPAHTLPRKVGGWTDEQVGIQMHEVYKQQWHLVKYTEGQDRWVV